MVRYQYNLTQSWESFLEGFEHNRSLLENYVQNKQLLYIYSNGYVLPNKPFDGNILNNNGAIQYDLWLRENLGG